jgi:hypothetical protein
MLVFIGLVIFAVALEHLGKIIQEKWNIKHADGNIASSGSKN